MDQQLVSQVTTIGNATSAVSMTIPEHAVEYSVELITKLTEEQRTMLQKVIRHRPFGAVTIPCAMCYDRRIYPELISIT